MRLGAFGLVCNDSDGSIDITEEEDAKRTSNHTHSSKSTIPTRPTAIPRIFLTKLSDVVILATRANNDVFSSGMYYEVSLADSGLPSPSSYKRADTTLRRPASGITNFAASGILPLLGGIVVQKGIQSNI